ncbi:MAG: hypothetical protein J6R33_05545 [Clostridia bacterium]|nr:hypothetical protein [Clostridia bacterium]
MDYCINCGADLTDDMEKCPECGAARFGRKPAPFKPTFPAHREEEMKEKPVIEELYVPQEPQEEVLRDQPAPVHSGHEPGEPVIIDEKPSEPADLTQAIASVQEAEEEAAPKPAVDELPYLKTDMDDYEEYYDDPAYDVLSSGQYMGTVLMMSIPVIGWLATLIWALGGTKNFNRRNLARGVLLTFLIVVGVLAIAGLVLSYFFGDIFNMITDKVFAVIDVFKK